MEEQEKKIENKKHIQKWILIGLVAAAGISLVVLVLTGGLNDILGRGGKYTLQKTGVTASLEIDHVTMTESVGNLVVRSNRNGVKAVSADGKVKWDVAYSMTKPYLLTAGEYVCVADREGKEVRVVGIDGSAVKISAEGTILFHAMSAEGKVALVVAGAEGHSVSLYSAQGELLLRRQTYSGEDGIPLAIAISEDGRRMATSYISYIGKEVACSITAFDLSADGSGLVDRILGSLRLEGTLVTDLHYAGGVCFYIGDDRVGALDTEDGCVERWSQKLKYRINSVAFGKSTFSLGLGEGLGGGNARAEKDFVIYSANGELLCEKTVNGVTDLEAFNGGYSCAGGNRYFAIDEKGAELWTFEAAEGYRKLLPLADGEHVGARNNEEVHFYSRIKVEAEE